MDSAAQPNHTETLHVLIIQPSGTQGFSFRSQVKKVPSVQIVGEVDNATSAQTFMKTHEVDLVITNLDMPIIDELQAVHWIKKQCPLVISVKDNLRMLKQALCIRAQGYCSKTANSDELTTVFQYVLGNHKYLAAPLAQQLLGSLKKTSTKLSKQNQSLLEALAEGKSLFSLQGSTKQNEGELVEQLKGLLNKLIDKDYEQYNRLICKLQTAKNTEAAMQKEAQTVPR